MTGLYNWDGVCLLRGTDGIFIYNSTFCPHSVFMCFVWIWEQTAIISLYSINWLVFITETESVYCAVWAECLNIIVVVISQWRGTQQDATVQVESFECLNVVIRNVGRCSPKDVASRPRRPYHLRHCREEPLISTIIHVFSLVLIFWLPLAAAIGLHCFILVNSYHQAETYQ